jgi:phosphoserine aminotransferase
LGVARALDTSTLGRSHRSKPGKAILAEAIALTREILRVPDTITGSASCRHPTRAPSRWRLWSLLGERGVDMVAWEILRRGLDHRRCQAAEA